MSTKLDYLKKYLSKDKKTKKKKKHLKNKDSRRIKIIDDNEFASGSIDNDECELIGEDAPQIVNMEEFETSERKKLFIKDNWENLSDQNKSKSKNSEIGKNPGRGDLSNATEAQKQISRINDFNDVLPPVRKINISLSDDLSPPRKNLSIILVDSDNDMSPDRNKKLLSSDDDLSPQRNSHLKQDTLAFPVRINHSLKNSKPKSSGSRKKDMSPIQRTNNKNRRSSEDISPKRKKTEIKKLNDRSNRKLGFQNAQRVREENEALHTMQDELFQHLFEETNNHEPIVRKSRRDAKIPKTDLKKEEELKKKMEVYQKWGKGLKQIEVQKAKEIDEKIIANMPLARYSDDRDLDEMLKNTAREGDPMLEYIKKNKKVSNERSLPVYKGLAPENRFNIRPGYRWDGLDRSNGYEKKYFDMQNKKRAMQEEAYKYSTEDM